MGHFRDFDEEIKDKENIKILIVDNNNLEFCSQHEEQFPKNEVFENYDAILIPQWVYTEIEHSQKRLDYLTNSGVPYYIMSEVEDYVNFMPQKDYKLMRLFESASNSIGKARKHFSSLKKYYEQNADLPENWIANFYNSGFDTKASTATDNGEVKLLKKNAGETSILVLTYLLIHCYQTQIKQITIFSSDKGSLTIKKEVMDHLPKIGLIYNPRTSVSFKSTDILLIEAYKNQKITLEDVERIRTNSKSAIYTLRLDDSSSSRHEHVLDTTTFITILNEIDNYHFEF